MSVEAIVAEVLQLSKEDRDRLICVLLDSFDPQPDDTPENIAKAWDAEIARRVDELDAGLVESIPYEQVMAELRSRIESNRKG